MIRPPPMLLAPRALYYWSVFEAAASRHGLDALLLASICDVESMCGTDAKRLDVIGPGGRGDKGHGHGLFQIDDRTLGHRRFIQKTNAQGVPLWTLPEENTEYVCAEVLGPALRFFRGAWLPSVAAFNAGAHAVQAALAQLTAPSAPAAVLKACNEVTANGNYVTRVITRFRDFGGELPEHEDNQEDT